MSLLFIVDGYNAIKRSSLFRDKRLREAREAFCSYIDHHRPHGSRRNRLIVVFDGVDDVLDFPQPYSVEVVFTKGESADEKIKDLVGSSPSPRSLVVVTEDRDLGYSVRRRGAKVMGIEEFLSKGEGVPARRSARRPRGEDDPSPELNGVQREAITEELRRVWLKKKSC